MFDCNISDWYFELTPVFLQTLLLVQSLQSKILGQEELFYIHIIIFTPKNILLSSNRSVCFVINSSLICVGLRPILTRSCCYIHYNTAQKKVDCASKLGSRHLKFQRIQVWVECRDVLVEVWVLQVEFEDVWDRKQRNFAWLTFHTSRSCILPLCVFTAPCFLVLLLDGPFVKGPNW